MEVDIFSANAGYRGLSFWGLWSGGGDFLGWKELSKKYNKPLFIAEYGWHQANSEINYEIPGNVSKKLIINTMIFFLNFFN